MTLTFEKDIGDVDEYWKFGLTPDNDDWPHWYQIEMDIIGNRQIRITLTDNGLGDDILTGPDARIVDQGGPGHGPAGDATGVPVFPTWYVGLAAALGAGVLAYLYRRRVLGRKTVGI